MRSSAQIESGTAAPPPSKAKVSEAWALVPAMAGLIILGIALVGLVWLASRSARRRIRKPFTRAQPVADEWYGKPLNRPLLPRDPPSGSGPSGSGPPGSGPPAEGPAGEGPTGGEPPPDA